MGSVVINLILTPQKPSKKWSIRGDTKIESTHPLTSHSPSFLKLQAVILIRLKRATRSS